MKIRPVEA